MSINFSENGKKTTYEGTRTFVTFSGFFRR
jgi:hypothetical protein